VKSLVLLSFSLTFLTQVLADDSFVEEASEQVSANTMSMQFEDAEQEWCLSPYHAIHASVRHNEARGIGYKKGYTTLEFFGIYDGFGSDFMPFFDLRGHVFNDGKVAGNLGIGERSLISSINHIYGSYIYYDVRKVGHSQATQQISPGFELVGERMEYRVNGYFPIVKRKGRKFDYKFDKFTGNNILLKYKQNQTMMGGDAEVGVHIPQNTTYDVYAAAGPYYFHSSNASAWGGRVRFLGRYKEYVSLEVDYSYDKLFRNIVQGSVALTVPFGGKLKRCGRCCGDNLLLSRASFAPARFEIPVVKKVHKKEKAINPATGNPWVVWFVNNTSHSAGTFESPFSTLLAAQTASSPNNMIYVFPGDGTTTGMDAGITLKDGQNFFGSGTKQQFATKQGTIAIPAFSNALPVIAGDVTTGNSNVISGFNVTSGIVGNSVATNLNNLTVANNIIATGILFQGTGSVNIYNNTVTGVTGAGAGIGLFAAPQGLIAGEISNNFLSLSINPPTDNGILLANVNENNPGVFNFSVANNTITQYPTAIRSTALGTNSTIEVIGNTIFGPKGVASLNSCIVFQNNVSGRNGQNGSILIANNNVTQPNNENAAIGIFDNALPASPLFQETLSIQDNVLTIIETAGGGGIEFITANTLNVTMIGNIATPIIPTGLLNPSYFFITQNNGIINIGSLENNTGTFGATGNVNLVLPSGD